jgi:nucleoside-diphosphate-sugar epimerase
MRVVVTGASGNVGTSLLDALSSDPRIESVVGLARRPPEPAESHERWGPKVTWQAVDVVTSPLGPAFAGADAVVHLAWAIQPSRRPDVLRATNVVGSGRVFQAVVAAGVRRLVYASSVGAYSPGPKEPVDERWPTGGIGSSFYARHKAEVERFLDGLEAARPEVVVVRLRPGLIFKREAAAGIRRLFLGHLVPPALLRPSLIPIVPRHPRLVFQAVHTTDVADAYRRAVVSDVRGAFNIAADPVLDADTLANALGARAVPVPLAALRAAADLSWRLRLQPTPKGWVDMAAAVPVLDTTRARDVLGWTPTVSSTDALIELLEGLADGAEGPTPALSSRPPSPRAMEDREARVAAAASGY